MTEPPLSGTHGKDRSSESDISEDGEDCLSDGNLDGGEQEKGEAADGLMHVGSHVVRLDSRLREMSAGIYEGLPRGTAYRKALQIRAEEAGLSAEAFAASGNAQVHEDPAHFKARAASFLDWVKEKYVQELSERKALGAPPQLKDRDIVFRMHIGSSSLSRVGGCPR